MNDALQRPSLVDRINRRTSGVVAGIVLANLVGVTTLVGYVHRDADAQRAAAMARFAALTCGADAAWTPASGVRHIAAFSSEVLGVAIVDADGAVTATWPADLSTQALQGSFSFAPSAGSTNAAPTTFPNGAGGIAAWRTTLPAAGSNARTVVWVRQHFPWSTSLEQSACLAAGLLTLSMLLGAWLRSTTRSTVRALFADLTTPVSAHAAATSNVYTSPASLWSESAGLKKRLAASDHDLNEARMRIASLEKQMERALRHHEKRYARTLEQTRLESLTDPLTGLYNRRFLDEELPKVLADVGSRNSDVTVVMIDLDHFKQHNDAHGHEAGDALLRFVGDLLRGATRETDFAIRYGGDEFALIMPDTPREQALPVVERIIKLFGQYASVLKTTPRVSMSAGLACTEVIGAPPDGARLLKLADRALYESKSNGKNRVTVAA